ncbi:hypothetical protein VHEMI02459 [[Torrubiella] hemipterigena]|uniref:Uncharacterized protein n=1 Tax=[Torrubiella] hemipterigena TaxID=1531966 RepID=A0A0A1SPN5_9HYPO|nr:hypothetical protein VHEMI02459 [[Torrubiella] hemipterigena]
MKPVAVYSTVLGCLATEAAAGFGHIINQVSSFAHSNTGGLSDITFPIQLGQVKHTSGFYFAQTWYFNIKASETAAYIGLQPRPDSNGQTVLHAAFSSFVAGTKTTHPNCYSGADSGAGVSCAVEIPQASYDHVWDLTVASVGNNTWRGTMTDSVTKAAYEIGVWTIPSPALITKNQIINFFEYYPFNAVGVPDCKTLPKADVTFYLPTSKTGSHASYRTPYEVGDCQKKANVAWKQLASGAWSQSAGFW